jgi:hypothetical protein
MVLCLLIDPATSDFIRDTLSAVAAGLILVGLSAFAAHWRISKTRMDRMAGEIRFTQKIANTGRLYEGDL